MAQWALGYAAALVVVGVLDALWLGWIASDWYRRELGPLMTDAVRKVPAALFYFGYPAGLMALALGPMPDGLAGAALRSALVGLVAYGTYDLTALSVIRGYPTALALVDIAWGTLLSAAAGTAAYAAMRQI